MAECEFLTLDAESYSRLVSQHIAQKQTDQQLTLLQQVSGRVRVTAGARARARSRVRGWAGVRATVWVRVRVRVSCRCRRR